MSIAELGKSGLEQMDEEATRNFLLNQGTGVLALPTGGTPYVIPMSFGYDGDSRLYFTFVLGPRSRKESLVDETSTASFLVYDAKSPFIWQNAFLTGTLSEVPPDEFDRALATMTNAWHPDLFENAVLSGGTKVYQFEIAERSGVKHVGLPPRFQPS